jgi:hypothetical protein
MVSNNLGRREYLIQKKNLGLILHHNWSTRLEEYSPPSFNTRDTITNSRHRPTSPTCIPILVQLQHADTTQTILVRMKDFDLECLLQMFIK